MCLIKSKAFIHYRFGSSVQRIPLGVDLGMLKLPIVFKLGMAILKSVRYSKENVATLYLFKLVKILFIFWYTYFTR